MVGEIGAFDEVSNKELISDLLEKSPREFIPTEAEFKGRTETQIIAQANVTSTEGLLFTVPDNQTLWITSAFLTGTVEQGIKNASFNTKLSIRPIGGGALSLKDILAQELAEATIDAEAHAHFSMANTFPMPIKVEQGSEVILKPIGGEGRSRAGFQGWIEKRRVI